MRWSRTTSTVSAAQPMRARARATEDRVGRTCTASGPSSSIRVEPMPDTSGSPEARATTRRPESSSRRAGRPGRSGDGQARRSTLRPLGNSASCRSPPRTTSADARADRCTGASHPSAPMPTTTTFSMKTEATSGLGWLMLGVEDPLPHRPRRVVVAGATGSGKTTLARRIGTVLELPVTEMDALHHGRGLDAAAGVHSRRRDVQLRRRLGVGVAVPRGTRAAGRPRRHHDLARRGHGVAMARVVRRTVARRLRDEELWHGNKEAPLHTVFADPEHIVRWAWRTRHLLQRARPGGRGDTPAPRRRPAARPLGCRSLHHSSLRRGSLIPTNSSRCPSKRTGRIGKPVRIRHRARCGDPARSNTGPGSPKTGLELTHGVKAGAPRATSLPIQRSRRSRRHGARPHPHHHLACRRRRARARREGHGQIDDGPWPRLRAAADRGDLRRPVLHRSARDPSPLPRRPFRRRRARPRAGPYALSSCRSAPPRTACSVPSTWRRR